MLSRRNVRTTIVASSRIRETAWNDSQRATEMISKSIGPLGLRAAIGVILYTTKTNSGGIFGR